MDRARKVLTALCILLAIVPATGRAGEGGTTGRVRDELLVRFRRSASISDRASALGSIGGRVLRHIPSIDYDLVRVRGDALGAVARLVRMAEVAVAEPNYTGRIQITPNDACVNGCGTTRQWNLGAVNAFAGWSVFPGHFYTATQKKNLSPRVKVAVLDTKIDELQPDWRGANPPPMSALYDVSAGGQLDFGAGKDFVPASRQAGHAAFHGTFVAGILAAAANNGQGIAGLAYNADIVPITVVDGNGVATAADLASGIDHAVSVGARVINMSLGLLETSTAVQAAISVAHDAGALSVAAAGNNGNNQPFYPAWHAGVMSVTATDEADRPAPCTNHSNHTSVAAPGMNVLSMDTRTESGYGTAGCGTSTAAPHVSALAALLFAQNPSRSPEDVRSIIERTADDDRFAPGIDEYFGHGRINVQRALMDGVGPDVDRTRATMPRALGGVSVASAVARARSEDPILEAEWFVDSLGSPGSGGSVEAVDGAFGERNEELTMTIQVPLTFPTGVHRLLVRARDVTGWGAASVGALIVDRKPPEIRDLAVSVVAAPSANQPMVVDFVALDDYASRMEWAFTVNDKLDGTRVYESETMTVEPGRVVTEWLPEFELHGVYRVDVILIDEALNPSRAESTTVLV
ncbi:MAG TPA: S8 family serine peptidase [Actinomycetota bacterium]